MACSLSANIACSCYRLVTAFLVMILVYAAWTAKRKNRSNKTQYPPIVDIAAKNMFDHPREVYEEALQTHGPVIGVVRKGKLEYIVGESMVKEVLTNHRLFSFEEGTANVLNIRYIVALTHGTFFRDIEELIHNGLTSRMDTVVEDVFPIFSRRAKNLTALTSESPLTHSPDYFLHCHRTMAEVMITLILGKTCVNEQNLHAIEKISHDLAVLTGIYQNTTFIGRNFPRIWKAYTWLRVMMITVPINFFYRFGPPIWSQCNQYVHNPEKQKSNLLEFLIAKATNSTNSSIGASQRLRMMVLLMGLIFASVHTTAVVVTWVVYELARRPDYLATLQAELHDCVEQDSAGTPLLTSDSLRRAIHLDSFIREVMRLKGDTLSLARLSTCDAPLGNFVIPKGHLVVPLATTVHENPAEFGADAKLFRGFQWVNKNKPATMVGVSHIPFGLGRSSCPGRVLAVNEMKLFVLTLIAQATPSLREGTFRVADPMNIVAVPPVATLCLRPHQKPIF